MAYDFYVGGMLLPIAPSKLELSIENKNKTMTLINDGEINLLKMAGLTDISFDALLPQVKYPFANYHGMFRSADFYMEQLEKLKIAQEPFRFIVIRTMPNGNVLFSTNIKVSLEEYTIKEDAKQGFDIVASVKLKQYKDYGTKKCRINSDTSVTVENIRPSDNSPAPKNTAVSYTAKDGDTLWNIAKSIYGDGSQYMKIYNANQDKLNSTTIVSPGTVLTLLP